MAFQTHKRTVYEKRRASERDGQRERELVGGEKKNVITCLVRIQSKQKKLQYNDANVFVQKRRQHLLGAGRANRFTAAVYKWQPLDGNRFYDDSDTSCHLSGVKQVGSAS